MNKRDQVFLVGQKAFIRNEKGDLLILFDENIGIDLPGGKIQEGETDLRASLKREVLEETGLKIQPREVFYTWTILYPLKKGYDRRSNGYFYLVGYHATVLKGSFKISHEHTGYQWISKKEFQKLKEKRGHYNAVKYYFDTYS